MEARRAVSYTRLGPRLASGMMPALSVLCQIKGHGLDPEAEGFEDVFMVTLK